MEVIPLLPDSIIERRLPLQQATIVVVLKLVTHGSLPTAISDGVNIPKYLLQQTSFQ